MPLDTSAFANALAQLETSLGYLNSDMASADAGLRCQFRLAAIHWFKCNYDLATKMVRRQLAEIVLNPPALPAMPFMDLMRTAADAGLIRDARPFHGYREKRNITSHTYDEKRAEEVLTVVGPFLDDARFLLAELKRRNA
jgi:nucleotidyltransferase substrate binding protein (TIGR01987 family)